MKQTNLCLVMDPTWEKVLLWNKVVTKSGFTTALNKLNGPWWKPDYWETMEAAMLRELVEEAKIRISEVLLQKKWTIIFHFNDKPEWDETCTLFLVDKFDWEYGDTEEMVNRDRAHKDALPFDRMREADSIRMPRALNGEEINVTFWYDSDGKLTRHERK